MIVQNTWHCSIHTDFLKSPTDSNSGSCNKMQLRCKLLRFFWLEQWGNISCSTPKYTPSMGPRRLGRLLMKVCSAPRKQFADFWDAFCLCMKVFTKSCKRQCLYIRVHVNYQKEMMTRRKKK